MKVPRTLLPLLIVVVVGTARPAAAYSVLAHEAVIDAAWEATLAPALRARFRGDDEALRNARAFAYGGCLIQDLGYYPFSSRFFGNLTHYVRSGDFVAALIAGARDINEYAFALGALAHYAADTRGHALAVNLAVPLVYPELRAKYGREVTYLQNPAAHLKTEFGFDVLQVARGRYAPDTYHDFIGFEVSRDLLSRAFRATYGLDIDDVFVNLGMSIATFRWTVNTMVPEVTKIAWETRREEIDRLNPGGTRDRFVFASTRADFEHRWGTEYKRPGFWHRLGSWLLRLVPRFGPFKPLAYRTPTPEAERLFIESFDATVDRYRSLVQSARSGTFVLENRNFDTGRPIAAGEYRLLDETYLELLNRLSRDRFRDADPVLKRHVLAVYADRPAIAKRMRAKEWRRLERRLAELAKL